MTNIRNPRDFLDSYWDWTPYNSCFNGTNIRISDIDGIVERKGKFLLLETKKVNMSYEDIPTGQMIMFRELVKTGLFIIYIIFGKVNQPERLVVLSLDEKGEIKRKDLELNLLYDLKHHISYWFNYANRTGSVNNDI